MHHSTSTLAPPHTTPYPHHLLHTPPLYTTPPPTHTTPIHHNTPHKSTQPQNETFGEPFLLKVGPQETLSSVKTRIQAKLGISDDDFAKWKFAVVRSMRSASEPLADEDVVAAKFAGAVGVEEGHMGHDNYLALEHEATGRRGGNKSRGGFSSGERAIKIYG